MADYNRLKILFLTPRFPYPIIGGDRLKPFMILKHLAKHHDVTLLTFNHGGYPNENYLKQLINLGLKVIPVPLDPVKAAIRTVPLTLFTNQPLEIAFYNQSEFSLKIEQLFKKNQFDLAFAFFMRTAEYLKNIPVKKILMAEDCRTVYQKRSSQQSGNIKQKLVRWWEVKKLRKYEPEIMNHFDTATFVTEEDIIEMKKINPNARYQLLTNGTDTDKFIPPPSNLGRNGLLFAGKLDIWANVLMINRIVNNIMPLVWDEMPDVKLKIVGANPSGKILSLASSSIEVIPDVPDMVPYLQQAEVFIHPHDGGTGIQNKLIEAMSCSCPVVTTSTGSQGLHAVDEENIMIGNSDTEIASKVIKILQNKILAEKIGVNARQTVIDNLSWNSVYSQLDKIIESVLYN